MSVGSRLRKSHVGRRPAKTLLQRSSVRVMRIAHFGTRMPLDSNRVRSLRRWLVLLQCAGEYFISIAASHYY